MRFKIACCVDLRVDKPWFILETVQTSDGPRTRVCDGFYLTRAAAEEELRVKEAKA